MIHPLTAILASLTIADLCCGLTFSYYNTYLLIINVFGKPCEYRIFAAALVPAYKIPPYASCLNVMVVALDRYTAILHPYVYDTYVTGRVVAWTIGITWVFSFCLGASYAFWFADAVRRASCTIIPPVYHILDTVVLAIVEISLGGLR